MLLASWNTFTWHNRMEQFEGGINFSPKKICMCYRITQTLDQIYWYILKRQFLALCKFYLISMLNTLAKNCQILRRLRTHFHVQFLNFTLLKSSHPRKANDKDIITECKTITHKKVLINDLNLKSRNMTFRAF